MSRRTALLFALTVLLAGCATNPVSGNRELSLISEQQEVAIGREQHPQILKAFGVYADDRLQAYVERVGQELASKSHRADLDFQFTLLDSPEVNAFALPGGYIYITRGLLAYLNSEDELAAVLGHEIGHVTARHSARQISAATAADLGFTLGAIFVPELRHQAVQNVYQTLGTALLRGYGREHELEADRLGAEYLARTERPPEAMIDVVRVLKNQELFEIQQAKAEGRAPRVYHGVFSTHPDNDTRLKEVVRAAQSLAPGDMPKSPRAPFVKRLAGLTFGESAHEGVLRHGKFYHQALDFGLAFPSGWQVHNRSERLIALAPEEAAGLQLSLADRGNDVSPRRFLERQLGSGGKLRQGQALKLPGDLQGYTALAPVKSAFGDQTGRIGAIFHGDRAYLFIGAAKDSRRFEVYDDAFLATIRSFHTLSAAEQELAEPLHLQLVTAKGNDSFRELAKRSAIRGSNGESQLRLLNARYPSGEPEPGELLKTLK